MSHHFNDHDPLVRAGRGVQAVDGIGGDGYCRVESERHVGSPHVVVDGFRNAHHIDSRFRQFGRGLLGAVTADAHDAVQLPVADGL